MSSTIAEVLARLNRALGRMDALLAGSASPRACAERLAELVAALDDRSAGGVCRMHGGGRCLVAACNARAQPRPDWEAALARDVDWQMPPGGWQLEAPVALELPRHRLAIVSDADLALALLLPAADITDHVRELVAAAFARARLFIDHHAAAELLPPSAFLAEEVKKGDVAEFAAVFHHELGNILNNLVLDADALERDDAGSANPRIRDIKHAVASFAEHMGLFVQYQHSRRTPAYLVDLHAIVDRCARALTAGTSAIRLELAGDVPPVLGTVSDLHRLVRLLLGNAVAAANDAGKEIVVKSERQGAAVLLSVSVPARELSAADWRRVFQPFDHVRDGLNGVELAVCRALLRRFQGKLRGDSPAPGVVRFTCEFALAAHN